MYKRGLLILNLGLFIVMLSAFDQEMNINYFILTTGLLLAIIGTMIIYKEKKSRKSDS